ncbi:MAG: hypothetical protein ABIH83_03690 [Candidatus Micrarchaeota archaeon]
MTKGNYHNPIKTKSSGTGGRRKRMEALKLPYLEEKGRLPSRKGKVIAWAIEELAKVKETEKRGDGIG